MLADLRLQRSEILEVAHAHGARRVRVFGSVARDDTTDTTDIDFLADSEPAGTARSRGGRRNLERSAS